MSAKKLIIEAKKIAILSHTSPDADTLGSQLGLYWALKKSGIKNIKLFNKSKIPQKYQFLPGVSKIKESLEDGIDLYIVVDCGVLRRAGYELKSDAKIISIDHHKSNEYFGQINIVDTNSASTTLLIYQFLIDNGFEITDKSAFCLYAGLYEDSGGFVYHRVNAKTFEIAAHLTTLGATPSKVAAALTFSDPLSFWQLKSEFMQTLDLRLKGEVAFGLASKEMFEKSGADSSISKELVLMLLTLKVVKVAVLILELEDKYKISLRSKGVDVGKIAESFGGGGHEQSASLRVKKEKIESIKTKILDEIAKYI
jgi:phosphoesterase RecJ-like protein